MEQAVQAKEARAPWRERPGGGPDPAAVVRSLAASARVMAMARRASEFGVRIPTAKLDLAQALVRARAIAERFPVDERKTFAATLPAVPGLADVDVLDLARLGALDQLPRHLLVLGGTKLGVEAAQVFARLGSRVSIVERSPQLLPREDRDVAAALAELFRNEGIGLYLEARCCSFRATGEGVIADLALPTGEKALNATHLFLPPPDELDEGPPMQRCISVLTDPPLGRIGWSEAEARRAGRRVFVAKAPFVALPGALERGETQGLIKVVADAATDEILGACVLGAAGLEIAAVIEVAMAGHVPYTLLRDGLCAQSSLAQSFNRLFTPLDEME